MTAPDPKTVRQVARKFLLDPRMTASDLKALVRDAAGANAPDETFSAWYDAVRADARKAVVETVASWPDEQQPAEATGGEQVQNPRGSFWADLDRHLENPKFRKAYVEQSLRLQEAEAEQVQDGAAGRLLAAVNDEADVLAAMWELFPKLRDDLRAVLAERDALAARVAELEAELRSAGEATAAWHTAADCLHDQLDALDITSCPCGCQPGQNCGCGLEDCECAGDCLVCDHDPDAHTGDDAEGCPMCARLRQEGPEMPDAHDEHGAIKVAVNRLTAICEYVETYGKWPRTRAAKRDAADLRGVLAALATVTAELGRMNRRANFLDDALDGMRQQAIEAVKARNEATARAEKAERKLAERDQLRDEYGIRVFYVNTLIEERAIADTLAGALAELDRFDAQGRSNVASRKLRVREVGGWRDVEQEAEQREEGARAKFAADLDQLRKTDPGGAQWVEHIVSERTDQQPEDGDRG